VALQGSRDDPRLKSAEFSSYIILHLNSIETRSPGIGFDLAICCALLTNDSLVSVAASLEQARQRVAIIEEVDNFHRTPALIPEGEVKKKQVYEKQ